MCKQILMLRHISLHLALIVKNAYLITRHKQNSISIECLAQIAHAVRLIELFVCDDFLTIIVFIWRVFGRHVGASPYMTNVLRAARLLWIH